MEKSGFSLKIGSLLFRGQSIKYIIWGLFLIGLFTGMATTVHIEDPEISLYLLIIPLFIASILPIYLVTKGIRKAENVE